MIKEVKEFVNYWRALRSSTEIDIDRCFRYHANRKRNKDLIYISEKDLQLYLYLNIKQIFPECEELILYERPLFDRYSTNAGRYDFVFLTKKKKLKLIETKVIDTEYTGTTAQARRRRHRRKVIAQVLRGKYQLYYFFNIPKSKIECAIVTTDPLIDRRLNWNSRSEVESAYISFTKLRHWFRNEVNYKGFKKTTMDLGFTFDDQSFGYP